MNESEEKRSGPSIIIVIFIASSMLLSSCGSLSFSLFPTATGTTPIVAINEAPDPMIRLRYANFDPLVSEPSIPSMLKAPAYLPGVKAPCIVQSKGKITEEWKAELEKAGAEIVGYIPDNALLVRMNQASRDGVNQLNSVNWCGNYEPAYKVSPDLNGLSGLITIDINFFIKGTNGPTVRFLRDNGAEFLGIANNDKVNTLTVKADASLINEIISHPDVKWMSQYQQPEMCNNPSTQLLQSGATNGGRVIADDPGDAIPGRQINGDLKNDGAGFGDGDRKVVAVCDSGILMTHEVWSEAGKVIDNYVPEGSSGDLGVTPGDSGEHGQATASMVCGDAPGYVDYTISGDGKDGSAFGARLIFQDIGMDFTDCCDYPPPDYYHDLFEDAQYGDVANGHIGGASVHSNSWGWGGTPDDGYDDKSTQIDEYVWDNKDFVICFAAGNDGPAAQSIANEAEAKNCIAVGATDEPGTSIMVFSGRGPAVPDGRLKPDLVVVGWGITTASTASDTSYWADNFSGTSASAPGLAGHAILVQQYFEDGWYPTGTQVFDNGFTPSAAMVKAAMINGAVDIGVADVPNMDEGWGRVHLENSLYFQGDAKVVRYIDYGMNMPGTTKGAGLCTGDSIEYKFNVTGAASPFRVSLVWSDYKGDPAASIMLVNDLDLTVEAPGGSTYKGNVFSGGDSQTGGSHDVLNNIECVYFSSPTAGEYTITINASNIPIGPQDFALVVSGDMDQGYGIISMDRVEYTVQDTINLRVEDPNNPAGTVQVTLTSSGSGDSETFDLTLANTRTFVGSINTEFNEVIADDGILQVNNGDTVTATYSDANPAHNSIATATIQTFGPVITNVRVEDIMGITAVVKWDTDIPSNSTVYFGTGSDSALWTDVQGDSTYTTAHTLPVTGLTMETLYYFDVAASTTRGATSRDDFGGSHYTFSTIGPSTGPMIFYVDDDDYTTASDGTPYNEDWENNFNAYGWTYTRWDIAMMGVPTRADMEQAKMVVWTVQEGYPQIGAEDRVVLGDYLEFSPDPKLFVVGQDVGWDMNTSGTDPDVAWFEKHFHAIFERDDADGGGGDGTVNVTGLAGDPISASYTGGISLDQNVFGAGRFWPDDISNNGGTICWDYDFHAGGGNAAGIRANEAQTNAHTGYPGYRIVYEAWSHEMMGTWNPPVVDPIRSDVMDKSLIWLLGGDHPDLSLTYPTGGETLSGTETITWSSTGSLNTKVFYSPNNGQAWHLLYEDPTGTATGYNWDTTTVDDGTTYQVKVLVTGVGDSTYYETSGSFAVDNGIDNTGPAVVAGSVKVDPQPTYAPASATLTATITDVGRGDSNIVAAQYLIDGVDGPWPMTGAFVSTVEAVSATLSGSQNDGDHLVEVRGQDMIGNWGAWYSFIWYVVNPDPLPNVNVIYPNGAEIISGDCNIDWTANDNNPLPPDPINIYYSPTGSAPWFEINGGVYSHANDGSENWDTTLDVDGANYAIRIECTDDIPQIGFDESDATFNIDNVEDVPVVDVTYPNGGEFFQIGLVEAITWTATDADPGDVLTIDIYYSPTGIAPWTLISAGEANDYTYPWTVPVDYTTTARVRIVATDTTFLASEDISDADFEIGSELFLQVQASAIPPYENLNTDGFEVAIQEISTPAIPAGGGTYQLGDAWITDTLAGARDIAGDWTFNIFGEITGVTGVGALRAEVYSLANGWLFSSTCPEDVAGYDTYYEFSWTEVGVVSQSIPDGDRVYVEFYLDATAGGGSSQLGDTLNPDFTVDASNWAYTQWEVGVGGWTSGNYQAAGGNPTGYVNITLAAPLGGAPTELTYSGYWEQAFTTGFVPTAADLVLDWSCLSIGLGDSNMIAYAFVDTASGAPTIGTEVWTSGVIGATTPWASVGPIDVSGIVNADTTYYVKVAFRDTDLARFEGSRELGFDNVKVSWSEIIPEPVFTLGYDNIGTPSSVCPVLNLGGPPPVTFDIDISMAGASNWVFISFPITATGDVLFVFNDTVWGGGITDWDIIMWYNPSDADHWKTYNKNYPGTQDMPDVNNTMGVWVHLTANDGFLTVGEGQNPSATTITLQAGWNLVGFPSQVEGYTAGDLKTDSGGLVSSIERFNAAAAYDIEVMPDGDAFQIGQAYWVYTTAVYAWLIP